MLRYIEAHTGFFPKFLDLGAQDLFQKPIWEKNKAFAIMPDKKKHGLGIRRETYKIKCPIPDDFGLRSSVIQKPFHTKSSRASIGARAFPPWNTEESFFKVDPRERKVVKFYCCYWWKGARFEPTTKKLTKVCRRRNFVLHYYEVEAITSNASVRPPCKRRNNNLIKTDPFSNKTHIITNSLIETDPFSNKTRNITTPLR